jgi:Fe-Mn family superoxide dismutase
MLTRRTLLTSLTAGSALLVTGSRSAAGAQPAPGPGQHTLPPLPYPPAALEPHLDAQTMTIHHGRHHKAYVDNLNAALAKAPELASQPLDQLLAKLDAVPEAIRTTIRNNGGGHWNHTQFWTAMAPNAGGPPTGAIADAINGTFGSYDKFKGAFTAAALGRFGSGWAWLSDDRGTLVIHSTANQDTPSMEGKRGILGLDVWEHAYYLKYQNMRNNYVAAWYNTINWSEVNKRLKS